MFEGSLLANILAGVLSVLFLFFSSIKIFGWQKIIFSIQMEFMKKYGINRLFYGLIGVIEFTSALMVIFQGSIIGLLGAAGIAFTSLGAIFFHVRFDTFKDMIPALITLTMSLTIIEQELLINSIRKVCEYLS
mgnify:CR=1 FL=1